MKPLKDFNNSWNEIIKVLINSRNEIDNRISGADIGPKWTIDTTQRWNITGWATDQKDTKNRYNSVRAIKNR